MYTPTLSPAATATVHRHPPSIQSLFDQTPGNLIKVVRCFTNHSFVALAARAISSSPCRAKAATAAAAPCIDKDISCSETKKMTVSPSPSSRHGSSGHGRNTAAVGLAAPWCTVRMIVDSEHTAAGNVRSCTQLLQDVALLKYVDTCYGRVFYE